MPTALAALLVAVPLVAAPLRDAPIALARAFPPETLAIVHADRPAVVLPLVQEMLQSPQPPRGFFGAFRRSYPQPRQDEGRWLFDSNITGDAKRLSAVAVGLVEFDALAGERWLIAVDLGTAQGPGKFIKGQTREVGKAHDVPIHAFGPLHGPYFALHGGILLAAADKPVVEAAVARLWAKPLPLALFAGQPAEALGLDSARRRDSANVRGFVDWSRYRSARTAYQRRHELPRTRGSVFLEELLEAQPTPGVVANAHLVVDPKNWHFAARVRFPEGSAAPLARLARFAGTEASSAPASGDPAQASNIVVWNVPRGTAPLRGEGVLGLIGAWHRSDGALGITPRELFRELATLDGRPVAAVHADWLEPLARVAVKFDGRGDIETLHLVADDADAAARWFERLPKLASVAAGRRLAPSRETVERREVRTLLIDRDGASPLRLSYARDGSRLVLGTNPEALVEALAEALPPATVALTGAFPLKELIRTRFRPADVMPILQNSRVQSGSVQRPTLPLPEWLKRFEKVVGQLPPLTWRVRAEPDGLRLELAAQPRGVWVDLVQHAYDLRRLSAGEPSPNLLPSFSLDR